VKFSDGWIIGETLPCQICLRESIKEGVVEEQKYFGGVGTETCSKCKRSVCPIHFSNAKQLCNDCWQQHEEKKK
jgi:hypothetical protein